MRLRKLIVQSALPGNRRKMRQEAEGLPPDSAARQAATIIGDIDR